MKRKLIFILSLLICSSLFGTEPVSIDFAGTDGEAFLYTDGESSYFVLPFVGEYAKLDESVFFVDSDGYSKFKYNGKTYVIIWGEEIQYKTSVFNTNGKIDYSLKNGVAARDRNIKSISASSFLSEKIKGNKINYSADNLYKCVSDLDHTFFIVNSHLPWVDGIDGDGIGETITIEYKEPVAGISMLNGYVELNKLSLYKENSRAKEIEIEDLQTGKKMSVLFEDKVYFKYIPFSEKTSSIKIQIKSVYPGSKYSDTCISAIVEHKYEYKSSLSTYLKNNKSSWTLEPQKVVLNDYFSGMDLFTNKYNPEEVEM